VCWDVNSAAEYVAQLSERDDTDLENYFIHEVQMQDPYSWITHAMQGADKEPVVPNYHDALDWMVSEIGEAVGARVASKDAWVRNNPEKHTQDSVDWEIGQAILMGILALGMSPIGIIRRQLEKWGYKSAKFKDDTHDYYEMLFTFPRGGRGEEEKEEEASEGPEQP
jgi:hypothetical protein